MICFQFFANPRHSNELAQLVPERVATNPKVSTWQLLQFYFVLI